jgi:hypothetical protein
MEALVVSTRRAPAGSLLAADLSMGASQVVLDDAADFFDSGGQVLIGGQTLTYTSVLWKSEGQAANDTLVLDATSPVAGTAYADMAAVPGKVSFIAQVRLHGTDGEESAVIPPGLASELDLEPGIPDEDITVWCEYDGPALVVKRIVDREPKMRPEVISDGVIGASVSIPNLTEVPPVITTAIGVAIAGISSGGGAGNIAGGHWGDPYGSTAVHGGHWGDTYA